MAAGIELTLRPKADVKPLDVETAQRIGRVANAETVAVDGEGAVFGFSLAAGGGACPGEPANVHRGGL